MEKFIFGHRDTDGTQYTLYITHNTQNMIYINSQIILMLKINVTPDMINLTDFNS